MKNRHIFSIQNISALLIPHFFGHSMTTSCCFDECFIGQTFKCPGLKGFLGCPEFLISSAFQFDSLPFSLFSLQFFTSSKSDLSTAESSLLRALSIIFRANIKRWNSGIPPVWQPALIVAPFGPFAREPKKITCSNSELGSRRDWQ